MQLQKEFVGRAVFAGKHRFVFEALIEYGTEEEYPKDVVFAEMHENHLADNIIRMQFDAFGLFKFCRGIDEIIPLGEALLKNPLRQEKVQSKCRIYTRSIRAQTILFLGAKSHLSNTGKMSIGYYISMYRNGSTYMIRFDKSEILAIKDQSKELALRLWHRCMDAQSKIKNGDKQYVEVVYE
jgi:hypothetical protein